MIYEFFINNGFVFEMLVCNFLFVMTLKRRKFFILRFAGSFLAFFALSIFWSMFETRYSVWDVLKYTMLFIMAAGIIFFCFETNFWTALFCEIGAFATQHSAFKVGEILKYLLEGKLNNVLYSFIYLATLGIIYAAFYFIFARRLRKFETSYFENKQIIFLSIALLMFTVIFGQNYRNDTLALYLMVAFYDIMCCVFTLCMQYSMIKSAKMQQDFKVMEHVLYLQKQQMQSTKENIDIINIKCHDLKHQISQLGDRISADELKELTNAISIYDLSVKTGNEALDVILAEKSLFCGRQNIKLNCIADGKNLSFMKASDIYSLFGNAIDNAIEAVSKLENNDRRIISISVKESMGAVSIHFENFYNGKLSFLDALPLSTKEDKRYHGFGMKSIKMLTESYGGYFTLKTDDKVFVLNILLPIPAKAEK